MRHLLCWVLYIYYELLRKTLKVDQVGFGQFEQPLQRGQAVVLATPHTTLLPAILVLNGYPATFLASQSEDGGLVTFVLEKAGFRVVRGSSSRGAVAGLSASLKALQPGRIVGLTFDGPKGPPLVPKKGVALLARKCDGGTFLFHSSVLPRFWGLHKGVIRLGSWDRFHLLLPFAHLRVEVCPVQGAEPNSVLADIEAQCRQRLGSLYSEVKKSSVEEQPVS